MPTYEYECTACEATFEELLMSSEDVKRHAKEHPCPSCGRPCGRVVSAANFAFAGKAFGDPTNRIGSSGVHDLDYPNLDKAIGRSANRKWKEYAVRKEGRDQARRDLGTNAVSESKDGKVVATDGLTLRAREAGLSALREAKKQSGES